jgi:ribonuclease E
MTKRMLIDASQPEETRVVLLSGNRVEDFDTETASKQQLKGNIYLARVTRVEPSLQAAFVEYGGNRHGFLAFNEIHPDYYRIPISDREDLLAEQQAEMRVEADEDDLAATSSDLSDENDDENGGDPDSADYAAAAQASDEDDGEDEIAPEALGGDDEAEEVRRSRRSMARRYKIQEVISRRQILLVQVVKEERGNKGAALTTYLSLAGRYCVLMPNTARGGGVSRKIVNPGDRKRLKTVVDGLDVPEGMAVIVRTAGSQRTKAEIKRDYEYLLRLWDEIREVTLQSSAPCRIHEEANLIKRSIRDLYTGDIDEVLVEGEEGYKIAKSFMRTLVPSHAKRVQPYKSDGSPLLLKYQVESQLDAIHNPTVQLKSGGYIVLSETEALVAIDVNSGRATRERNIEETALRTNLEAADEVARQLRLRDLAGLVVIDYIDMEESRNRNAVERRFKDAMRSDRARVQIGRISHFGLLELSRQRLRPSLGEASTQVCPHCTGSGRIRSTDSSALHVLRAIEEEGLKQRASQISVKVPASIAFYIFNNKRQSLATIEDRYGLEVLLEQDDTLVPPEHKIERLQARTGPAKIIDDPIIDPPSNDDQDDDEAPRGRGRRRKRKPDPRRSQETVETVEDLEDEDAETSEISEASEASEAPTSRDDASDDADDPNRKRRRRGKRGGRRRGRRGSEEAGGSSENGEAETENVDAQAHGEIDGEDAIIEVSQDDVEEAPADAPEVEAEAEAAQPAAAEATETADVVTEEPKTVKPRRRARKPKAEEAAAEPMAESAPEAPAPIETPATTETSSDGDAGADNADAAPKRKGWWDRLIS